ncbi:hypothetical protein [Methanobrevibacter olleyae]|nr:hypothetical protein [Methanobrevibacter olleyae]
MELDSIISNDSTSYKGSIVYVLVNEGEYLKIEGGRIFLFYVQ